MWKHLLMLMLLGLLAAPLGGCRAEGELGDGDAEVEVDVDD